MNLIYRYIDRSELLHKLSRLAREELRHFEQVLTIMEQRGIEYAAVSPSRYASALRRDIRSHEPGRLVDTLIVGAVIEARSCERFAALAPVLPLAAKIRGTPLQGLLEAGRECIQPRGSGPATAGLLQKGCRIDLFAGRGIAVPQRRPFRGSFGNWLKNIKNLRI